VRIFKNMYMFLLMHVDLVSSVEIRGISSLSNQEHMSVVMNAHVFLCEHSHVHHVATFSPINLRTPINVTFLLIN
jgi:hypothetical protein